MDCPNDYNFHPEEARDFLGNLIAVEGMHKLVSTMRNLPACTCWQCMAARGARITGALTHVKYSQPCCKCSKSICDDCN